MENKLMLSYLFLALLAIHSTSNCYAIKQTKKHVALFIFGDSMLDVGNNNYIKTSIDEQANYKPYRETFFKFPTGRFSDGRLIGDFIAKYVNLPFLPPFLQPGIEYYNGVNFASGGAGCLNETNQLSHIISLKQQLGNYRKVNQWLEEKMGNDGAKKIISNAVYLFSIGQNDYISPYLTNSTLINQYSRSEYVDMVIGNMTSVLQEIYEIGGRKFVVLNLPPVGCHPGMRIYDPMTNGGCFLEVSKRVDMHNKALSMLLPRLTKQLQGLRYALFDFNNNIQNRINNPKAYVFRNGSSACCGSGRFNGVYNCGGMGESKEFSLCEDPNKYVFWDSFHFTEALYKQCADIMWNDVLGGVRRLFF